ncbi:MAG: stage II sporulation protein M [Acetatifactor sp.]
MSIVDRLLRIGGRRLLPLFLAGFAAGMIIMNIGKSILLDETGLFAEEALYLMKYITVDGNALFCFVLRKRLLFFGTVAVLATTYLGLAVCMAAVFWCGMSAGTFLTALMMRYGLKGFFLAIVSVFPQIFFYLPSFLLLLSWSGRLYMAVCFRNRDGEWREELSAARVLWKLAGIFMLMLLGCLMEGYVNPGLFIGYLKVF